MRRVARAGGNNAEMGTTKATQSAAAVGYRARAPCCTLLLCYVARRTESPPLLSLNGNCLSSARSTVYTPLRRARSLAHAVRTKTAAASGHRHAEACLATRCADSPAATSGEALRDKDVGKREGHDTLVLQREVRQAHLPFREQGTARLCHEGRQRHRADKADRTSCTAYSSIQSSFQAGSTLSATTCCPGIRVRNVRMRRRVAPR